MLYHREVAQVRNPAPRPQRFKLVLTDGVLFVGESQRDYLLDLIGLPLEPIGLTRRQLREVLKKDIRKQHRIVANGGLGFDLLNATLLLSDLQENAP